MIAGTTVVYLSAADWNAPRHLPQEIAVGLGAAGARVVYVESLGWRRPRAFDLPRIGGRLRRAVRAGVRREDPIVSHNVELISPVVIPGARRRVATALNRTALRRQIAGRVGTPTGPVVYIAFTPSRLALDVVERADADLVVYFCSQSHRHRPMAPPDIESMETRLIERADVVIADSVLLYRERAARHPHVYRVPGGVHADAHAVTVSPPAWLARLPRPVVGYVGTIDHRVDVELIAAVARARREWSVVMVGPVVDVSVSALAAIPNVTLCGAVPSTEVPAVMAGFDVGLMAYADLPMTPYTYPAKLHQYLASGLPIASTPLPDFDDFPNLVESGTGVEGLTAAVQRALEAPADAGVRRRVAAENSWQRRISDITEIIGGHLAGRAPRVHGDGHGDTSEDPGD